MWTRNCLFVGIALSLAWAFGAYSYDQYAHEQAIADVSSQCADLDDKHEEDDCRRRWREAVEARLPVPSGILSLALAFCPIPVAWLSAYLGMILNRRRRQRDTVETPGKMFRHVVPHREFASAILIDTEGRLLLQQRDNAPGIRFPGKIGLFGGHREPNETFLACVVREVHEEIGYFVPPERFEHITSYTNVDADGGTVSGEMFVARDIPQDRLVITEGSLLVVDAGEL